MSHAASLPLRDRWLTILASFWFIGGLFLDGWAHNHLAELETFFTPWHAVFYSGYAALALTLLGVTWKERRERAWREAIPRGYGWALAGIGIFFVGGIGDMLWHELLGVEADIEALLSPTHLILAAGMTLMLSAEWRAWQLSPASERAGAARQLPMILSLTFVVSLVAFMTQFAHPVDLPAADPDTGASLAIAGYLLQSLFLTGAVLTAARRSRLFPGALTLLLTVHMLGMGLMRDGVILVPAACLAGAILDLALARLQPLTGGRLRLFCFLLPTTFFALYTATLLLTAGTWWSIHLWAGAIVLPGLAGFLLGTVAEPVAEAGH